MAHSELREQDGNVIREGMTVVSGGDVWVVGAICPARVNAFIRLDRCRSDGRLEGRILGRRRWRSFVMRYRTATGTDRLLTLGTAEELHPEAARELARDRNSTTTRRGNPASPGSGPSLIPVPPVEKISAGGIFLLQNCNGLVGSRRQPTPPTT